MNIAATLLFLFKSVPTLGIIIFRLIVRSLLIGDSITFRLARIQIDENLTKKLSLIQNEVYNQSTQKNEETKQENETTELNCILISNQNSR